MKFVEPIRDPTMVQAMKKVLRKRGEKYYIMFLLGISLGLRINEILLLRVGDVKGKKESVFQQPKTHKEIAVAFNAELLHALQSYCKERDPMEALIPNKDNEYKAIGRVWAYKVLRQTAEKLGIDDVGTHTMRKTCGYHYYMQTKDIATLQVWLNHDNPQDTLRYIGVTRDRVKSAMINFQI